MQWPARLRILCFALISQSKLKNAVFKIAMELKDEVLQGIKATKLYMYI